MHMAGWIETCRSAVAPWECDTTEHFTIAYYFDRLADASATISERLGLRDRAGAASRRFEVRFARELRAGASFHILSAPVGLEEYTLRLGHQIVDSADGEVAAWAVETLADTVPTLPYEVSPWPGPTIESRPEPVTFEGFIPTGRDRVKPADLGADGNFTLAAFVHRFTTACVQGLAAIGATAPYMEAERRGYSTFELVLSVGGLPRLGDAVLVETGIVHLGTSSLRFVHRVCNPFTGAEFARLGQFGVQLDLDTRRPAAFPEALRSAAARLLVPTA
jgi:acyl-CoA thioesterase FadM